MKVYGAEEEEVEHVGRDETRKVERNDAAASETREMLEIGPDNASKLGCILVEPSSVTKNNAPKPQKKSTFCGEQQHLEEEKCSPNLMEQMIAEAVDAKASKYEEEQERRKHFGKGLKTGFLNTQTTSTSKTRQRKNNGKIIEVIEAPKSNANSLVLDEVGLTLTPLIPSALYPLY